MTDRSNQPDEGLDSVDRSSADSFPASDPPATTGSADLPDVPQGGTRPRIDPARLQKLLGGVEYPADKSTLVDKARQNGADDRALQVLEALPVGRFNRPDDVSEAVGNAT